MNISQEKREKMLMLLSKIKEEKKDDKDVVIALNEIENEIKNMKYGLMWEEHEEEVDKELENNIPIFSEEKDKEILVDEKGKFNFLLEGDNLHSLKLLQRTHKEKIDIIYIDPPYNTKNKDFIYDDNMIGEDDGYRHSKWLSFMQRRLEIAKDLLTDDGVIFISIDEYEYAQLKLLCDNIFGEQNYIENFIWNKNSTKNLSKTTSTNHEYILTYCKNISVISQLERFRIHKEGYDEVLKLVEEAKKAGKTVEEAQKELRKYYKENKNLKGISMYNNIDDKWDIFRISDSSAPKSTGKGNMYDVIHPITGKPCKKPSRGWAYTKATMEEHIKNNRIYFGKDETIVPQYKRYLTDVKTEVRKSIITDFTDGKKELQKIFGDAPFDNAKPTTLIASLISTFPKDSIILDFFAGSGTTGHAVAKLNAEDGGNRTYILCTNNENNICEEVTYKRLLGIQKELPHNLKYFKTDFLEKSDKELLYDLMEHIYEMVILENGYSKESKRYAVILTDEDMDELEENISEYTNLERIYMSNEVLLTSKQNNILSNYEIKYIPQYYFDNELKEMGEFW